MINIKKEIINLLSVLSDLNPGIPFKYNARTRKIVADVTTKRETVDVSHLNTPEAGNYAFNPAFGGRIEVLLLSKDSKNEKIAEISVDKCNLSDAKRDYYKEYSDYHKGDTYKEPIVEKLISKVKLPNNGSSIKYSLGENALKGLISEEKSDKPITKEQQSALEGFVLQFPKDREKSAVEADTTERKNSKDELSKEQKEAIESLVSQLPKNNNEGKKEKDDTIRIVSVPANSSIETSNDSDVRLDKEAGIFVPVKTKSETKSIFEKIGEVLKNSGFKEVKEDNNSNNWEPFTPVVNTDSKASAFEVEPNTIGTTYGAVASTSSINEDLNKTKENNVTRKESAFDRLKARVLYFFAPNRKVSGTEPLSDKIKRNLTFDVPRKIVKKPLRVKAKGLYEKISARVKYFFTRSAKPVLEPDKKDEPTKIEPKTPIVKPIVVPIKDDEPTKNDPSKNDDLNNKDNDPNKNDSSKNDEPNKPLNDDNSNKSNDIIKKQYELLEKEYYLASKLAYNKLGEYEKMFIDDVKAECIDVDNNEFRQMLNERCVNKEAIFNYYCELCELKQLMVMEAFDLLDEYEQFFVEDAIAETLEPGDSEYRDMLSERCVNKDKVNRYMSLFKEFRNDQNKVINAAYAFGFTRDYNALTINALRNLTKAHKNELTKGELGKFNASKLTKDELVDILKRSEVNMVKKYVKGE